MSEAPKEKPKRGEKFSEERLFEMIEASNTLFGNLTDDGEIVGQENPKLEKVIREIGSNCIDYQNHIHAARRAVQGAVFAGSVTLGPLAIALFSNDPSICASSFLFGLPAASWGAFWLGKGTEKMSKKHEQQGDLLGIKQAGKIKEELQNQLMALGLQKEYVSKNFSGIVRAFTVREREAREEDEMAKARTRLGLTDEKIEKAVHTLKDLQSNQKQTK